MFAYKKLILGRGHPSLGSFDKCIVVTDNHPHNQDTEPLPPTFPPAVPVQTNYVRTPTPGNHWSLLHPEHPVQSQTSDTEHHRTVFDLTKWDFTG